MLVSDKDLNFNLYKSNGFRIEIIDPDKPAVKLFNFFVQDTAIPSLTLGVAPITYQSNMTNWPSNRLDYEQLSCQMILNEDLSNYEYIYNWMRELRENENSSQYMRTIHLFTLGNTKLPLKLIKFHYAWPTALGSIPLQFTNVDVPPVLIQLNFAYQYFEIEKAP
jgi:hypothetical protein